MNAIGIATKRLAAPAPGRQGVWSDLIRHPSGRVGLAIGTLLVAIVLLGPLFTADPNQTDYGARLAAPGGDHLLGTDQAGRDLLARVVAGGRTTLGAALIIFGLSSAIGLLVGVAAGLARGWVDSVLSRLIDVLLGLPSLVVALAIVGALGPSYRNLILAMTFIGWAYIARVARSHVLGAAERPDVVAARMAGVGPIRRALGHVLPGVTVQVLIVATMELGAIILGLSALSFLGLGVQPPTAEWGQMLADSRFAATQMPSIVIGPGLAIMLSVAAAVLVSEALRDVVDPAWRRA